ncbi:hypothetical protein WFJ45_22190, partial [Salmonella enterica subsp. enterica serovar Minnesota]
NEFRSILRQLITYMMEDPRTISTALEIVWLSNRSGNDRLKNRAAGVVPSAARPSKLCSTVHT